VPGRRPARGGLLASNARVGGRAPGELRPVASFQVHRLAITFHRWPNATGAQESQLLECCTLKAPKGDVTVQPLARSEGGRLPNGRVLDPPECIPAFAPGCFEE